MFHVSLLHKAAVLQKNNFISTLPTNPLTVPPFYI